MSNQFPKNCKTCGQPFYHCHCCGEDKAPEPKPSTPVAGDAQAFTAGPWEVNLRHAEKINQYRFSVPIYSGGSQVARAFGPTMAIAIANAELMARAPEMHQRLNPPQPTIEASTTPPP